MKGKPKDVTDEGVERKSFKDLQKSLHLAVKLELFTIPFYFYTFYSLKNPKSHVGIHLREVIMEEMLHMAIVSNIMHALKGCKRPAYSPIKELEAGVPYSEKLVKKYVPFYPGYAPIYTPKEEEKEEKEEGDLRRTSEKAPLLSLDSLSKEQIVRFLRLELPELSVNNTVDNWQTIGEFYNYLKRQFLLCPNLEFNAQEQIELYTHNPTKERNTMRPIRNLKDALDNIDFIVEQGEGATFYNLAKHDENYHHQNNLVKLNTLVPAEEKKTELAHFYHFLIIYGLMGGKKDFTIETQSFNEDEFIEEVDPKEYKKFRDENVINLVKDPTQAKGRYPDAALDANKHFNENYSRMLDRLTYASVDDHRLNFGIALEQMTKFDKLAAEVKKFPLEDDPTIYCGPTFEYICP
jgi:rubrerythrin